MNLEAIRNGRGLTERAACKRLAGLAAKVPKQHAIVELGAYMGRTTAWLSYGAKQGHNAPVFAVDPWGDVAPPEYADHMEPGYAEGKYAAAFDEFDRHMIATGAEVFAFRSTATEAGEYWEGPPVGLLWHDAQHTTEAVKADLEAWLPHLAPHCVVALHDVCEPRFGVLAGAEAVLTDFDGPRIYPWKKHPDRRGMAVYRR